MSWIDEKIKGTTKEERLKEYLAYTMGTYCPDEEGLNNMVDSILYIVGLKTLEELKKKDCEHTEDLIKCLKCGEILNEEEYVKLLETEHKLGLHRD